MVYLWIALFSILGACSRYGLSLWIEAPMYTIIVNLAGAYCLGFCTTYFKQLHLAKVIQTGITTGFLGSFTTFSALSKDVIDLYLMHRYSFVVLYLLISILGGLICASIGMKAGIIIGNKRGDC
ncbi:CrcB family protein [Macrococcus capreoli]